MKRSSFSMRVGLSATGAVDEKARALRTAGKRVFDFGAGQPDFPTPDSICGAGIEAIRSGKTRYTSPKGSLELRRAVSDWFERRGQIRYQAETEILVSGGAKQSIAHLLAAVLDPGEEVLVPTPTWVSYPEMVRLLGGEPRYVATRSEERFRLTPESLKAALGPRVVGMILNSPCNPTGAVYRAEELEALAPVIKEAGIWVIADEIYAEILYGSARHVSLARVAPDLRERIAVVNGVSKAFSMTGWRIGFAAGPAEWIETAASIQSHQAGNPCSISQLAAERALVDCDEEVEAMRSTFERRRDLVVGRLRTARGVGFTEPEGAFYLLLDVRSILEGGGGSAGLRTDVELASWLLDETGVATVPGTAFAAPGSLRISFATSERDLEEGLDVMVEALGRLVDQNRARERGKESG